MKKVDEYINHLKNCADLDSYLMSESNLPGPRGNLELAEAFAKVGDETDILRLAALNSDAAPTNTSLEFLAFCGTAAIGRLLNEGKREYIGMLSCLASDPRWRVREAVAVALQCFGDENMDVLITQMQVWSKGN